MSRFDTDRSFFSGIVLDLHAGDESYDIEIQRNTSASTAGAQTIATVPGHLDEYHDLLPPDDVRRHYRIRHVRGACVTPSTWSRWVSAKPETNFEFQPPGGFLRGGDIARDPDRTSATIDQVVQNLQDDGTAESLDQLSRDIADDVFVDPAQTIRFGTASTGAGTVTKSVSYPASFFDARDEGTAFEHHPSAGYVHPNQSTAATEMVGTIVLPPRATITELRARLYRESTGNGAAVRIFENDNSPGSVSGTQVALASHSGTGWATASDTGLNLTVGSTVNYFFFSELNAIGGGEEDARLLWVELDYEIDDVKTAI